MTIRKVDQHFGKGEIRSTVKVTPKSVATARLTLGAQFQFVYVLLAHHLSFILLWQEGQTKLGCGGSLGRWGGKSASSSAYRNPFLLSSLES